MSSRVFRGLSWRLLDAAQALMWENSSFTVLICLEPTRRYESSAYFIIEDLWMQAKRKLRYQSGTSNGLFRSYLSAFQRRFSHKEHVFGQFINLPSDN